VPATDDRRNGPAPTLKPPKRPSNAFEIYSNDMRPKLQSQHKAAIAAGEFRLEEELARGWKDLDEAEKEQYQTRYAAELEKWKEDREAYRRSTGGGRSRLSRASHPRVRHLQEDDQDTASEQDLDHDGDVSQDVEMAEAAEADEREHDHDNDTDPETEVDDGADAGED
jgi:non-histone protein 10